MNINIQSSFTKDFGQAFSGHAIASLLRLGMTILFARTLFPEQYGLVALLLNSGFIVSSILEFGLGAAFIERESSTENKELMLVRFTTLIRGRFWSWVSLIIIASILLFFEFQNNTIILITILLATGQNLSVSFFVLYQVQQDYHEYARVGILLAFTQLIWSALFLVLFVTFNLELRFFLWGLAFIGWVPFILLVKKSQMLFHDLLFSNLRFDVQYLKKLFRFGKWV